MEIEKIVSTVQEKVGKTDFTAQTIQKAVELYPVADGQEPDDAYFAKVAKFVEGMQGQFNHDFATKFAEAKKNLLSADEIKKMNAEQLAELKTLIEGMGTKEHSQESEEVKLLKAELAKLTERLNNSDNDKIREELLKKVKASMKEQGAADEYVLEKSLEGVTLDEKKSVEDLTKEMLTKYDSEYLRCRGYGNPPRQASGAGGNGGQSWLDKKFAQKAKKEGWDKK